MSRISIYTFLNRLKIRDSVVFFNLSVILFLLFFFTYQSDKWSLLQPKLRAHSKCRGLKGSKNHILGFEAVSQET